MQDVAQKIKDIQNKINQLWKSARYAADDASDKVRSEIYELEKQIKQLRKML